jgi:hypothetical protein
MLLEALPVTSIKGGALLHARRLRRKHRGEKRRHRKKEGSEKARVAERVPVPVLPYIIHCPESTSTVT